MGTKQRFGGEWTIEKLDILSSYLDFYITALKNQSFSKIYIDAFAGTGSIKAGCKEEVIEGSAKLALKAQNKFDKYIFVERNKKFAKELNNMVAEQFADLSNRIAVYNADCNLKLQELCEIINWESNRAILFLDPYATEVKWETLKAIAATKAIDVWYLFPLSAANRLMKNDREIEPSWNQDVSNLSLKIIKMLNDADIACTALTKGILPIELAKLSDKCQYGVTLISLDETFGEKIEPGAAPYQDRINGLRALHEKGCKTWVSIEPYPTPNIIEQDFLLILEAIGFVDKIIFGRTNYNAEITKYKAVKKYYNELSQQVIDFCTDRNIEYHIKDGTLTEIEK